MIPAILLIIIAAGIVGWVFWDCRRKWGTHWPIPAWGHFLAAAIGLVLLIIAAGVWR